MQHFRFLAALSGHADVAQLLCGASADIDKPAHDTATPFSMASQSGHVEFAELLRKAGADVRGITKQLENKRGREQTQLNLSCIRPCKYMSVLAASDDSTAKIWDISTGERVHTLPWLFSTVVLALISTPGGCMGSYGICAKQLDGPWWLVVLIAHICKPGGWAPSAL